jgi:4-hydroxyproline epimerase
MPPQDFPRSIQVIDSHTEGEPTRVVVDGWPQPAGDTMAARRDDLRARFDHLRRAVVREPRGHEAVVGALLTPPVDPASAAGVVFFNNGTYLGMCGHGLIGVVRTLEFLGRLSPGEARFDTPVGTVGAELAADGTVTIQNVPAYVHARDVCVDVPGYGPVTGDIAWGGNWFFLADAGSRELALPHVESLTGFSWRVRQALNAQGHPEVDHVELYSASPDKAVDCRNFVLCPGKAYDRSPCGTGTSAKLACLAADGELAEGEEWVQESVIGSAFSARYRWLDRATGRIAPTIIGRAHVNGEGTQLLDPADPFCWGIR